MSGPDGGFTLSGVPVGYYRLRLRSPAGYGEYGRASGNERDEWIRADPTGQPENIELTRSASGLSCR